MTTLEQGTKTPTVEVFKSKCSPIGKRVLESSEYFAKRFKHDQVEISDIAHALFWNAAILEELKKVNIGSEQALRSFVAKTNRDGNIYISAGSIQDIFNVALEESTKAGASRIRAGDILMAVYNSPTSAGEALREALFFLSGQRKGTSFPTQLRSVINQVEKPWAA